MRGDQPAHHNRAAATAAADQFGDGVDLGGTERDHGGARRQAHQLDRAGVAELRHAGPRLHAGLRHQAMQQRADRLGAQKHGLHQPAGVQQPVGEDVPTVGVGAELDLVHRQELGVAIERHRFDGAGEPTGLGRDDLLLAGDQRDVPGALAGHHAVVVLPCQQAEGEADDARCVPQHALDGQMGLAGVRRTEDGFDARWETGGETGHGQDGWMLRRGMQAVPASGYASFITDRYREAECRPFCMCRNFASSSTRRKVMSRPYPCGACRQAGQVLA